MSSLKENRHFIKCKEDVVVGAIYDSHNSGKYEILEIRTKGAAIKFLDTGVERTVGNTNLLKNSVVDKSLPKRTKVCEFEFIENPFPENELPDLDYGGCRYLGYAGTLEDKKSPLYFFKCHCGNVFKDTASSVIKIENPSCGCDKAKRIPKVSSSLFELHMENWNPDTYKQSVKKLPIFKGIVGRESIKGFTYIDKEVYDVWSKIMWVSNPSGYAIATWSKDNCRRLKVQYKGCRDLPTLHLHRCVLGINNEVSYHADHINSRVVDNRKANLRLATSAQNAKNSNTNNKYGFKGIKRHKDKWKASIYKKGVYNSVTLGTYNTQELAALAYDLVSYELYGDHIKPNFPEVFKDTIITSEIIEVATYLTKTKKGRKFNVPDFVQEYLDKNC